MIIIRVRFACLMPKRNQRVGRTPFVSDHEYHGKDRDQQFSRHLSDDCMLVGTVRLVV